MDLRAKRKNKFPWRHRSRLNPPLPAEENMWAGQKEKVVIVFYSPFFGFVFFLNTAANKCIREKIKVGL